MAGLKKARRQKAKQQQQQYKTRQMTPQERTNPVAGNQAPANPFVMGTGNYGGTK